MRKVLLFKASLAVKFFVGQVVPFASCCDSRLGRNRPVFGDDAMPVVRVGSGLFLLPMARERSMNFLRIMGTAALPRTVFRRFFISCTGSS